MKHFLVYANAHKDKGLKVTNYITKYLEEKEQKVTVKFAAKNPDTDEDEFPRADCIIVLGGDGTVLQAARAMARCCKDCDMPLIGINLGTLGYMTDVEVSNIDEALERIINEDYEIESRMMLRGELATTSTGADDGWALNDIVISRCGPLQILRFVVYVNGQFLHEYNGDGIIITTPTGSTGYNLSAGGPIIEPKARLIMLTPVCPHTLNQRSIVLSAEDEIEIVVPNGKEGFDQSMLVSFDGCHAVKLETGDRVRVVKSEKTINFIKINQVSFLEVLHKKLSDS